MLVPTPQNFRTAHGTARRYVASDFDFVLMRSGQDIDFFRQKGPTLPDCDSGCRGFESHQPPQKNRYEIRHLGFARCLFPFLGLPWAAGNSSVPRRPGDQPSHVAIFATRHTVQTGVFATEIGMRAPSIRVSHQACPALATLIDCGAPEHTIRKAVRTYVAQLLDASMEIPDMCILGCTHYPLVEHIFADELPKGIRLLSQAEVTAASLKLYLERHPQFSSDIAAQPRYLTTGDACHVSALASRYYGRVVRFRSL
jgi:hypothetical protein